MRLADLATGFDIHGTADPVITGISEDSRRVQPGALFVAVPGTALDGHAFIPDALERGAAALVVERPNGIAPGVPVVRVASARRALAELAARFYGTPADELSIVGFTGTFGKTTTSDILRQLLSAAGARVGVVGSLGARYGSFHDPGNGLTTPAPVEVHRALRGLRDAGADRVIMEVTSHALRMGRVDGLTFAGGLIAAIMPGEHTDFHRTFEDYVAAKRRFLDYLAPDAVLAFDADNRAASSLAAAARAATRAGFSLTGRPAALQLGDVRLDHAGATFTVAGEPMHSALLGRGHLRNVALALAFAFNAGVRVGIARDVLRDLTPLPRRMARSEVGGRTVLDDTAAHPDSFRATFEVAGMLSAASPEARLIVVYALRGRRGADINRRNALALSDLAAEYYVDALVVSPAADVAGGVDAVTDDEVDAAKSGFHERGREVRWHETLAGAARDAGALSRPGDLVVLIGAQGMNEGKRLVQEAF